MVDFTRGTTSSGTIIRNFEQYIGETGSGDDKVSTAGLSSADIASGAGDDQIDGSSGNDTISAGADNDAARGGAGADLIQGMMATIISKAASATTNSGVTARISPGRAMTGSLAAMAMMC
ncbi:hypothetical protein HED52_15850 [Ochrobactrum ciceri]|uniref:Uncharacterized protein n=1 Tax=Brucella ciceri TaxID=391287 RepID=A0ABX1DYQ6_9HYPH|nr:hypothetical protein [Brucella ciceri]